MKKLTLIIICIAIASASAGVIAFAQKDETLSAEESSKSVSQDSSVPSSDELVKSLTVYKNVLRKYNYQYTEYTEKNIKICRWNFCMKNRR